MLAIRILVIVLELILIFLSKYNMYSKVPIFNVWVLFMYIKNRLKEIMLAECKTEEASQWENARHEIMSESITDSCNYYGSHNCKPEYESERERE